MDMSLFRCGAIKKDFVKPPCASCSIWVRTSRLLTTSICGPQNQPPAANITSLQSPLSAEKFKGTMISSNDETAACETATTGLLFFAREYSYTSYCIQHKVKRRMCGGEIQEQPLELTVKKPRPVLTGKFE